MAIGSPEISILPFAFSQADFISFPLKTALPKTSPVLQVSWNNGERRKGFSEQEKTLSGTPVVKTV